MRKALLLAALAAALATPARGALTTTNSVIPYTSNGVQTAFPTTFRFLDNSHLVVQKTDLSAVTTTLVQGTDFSVTGANAAAGGTVTLVSAIPSGWTLKIKRSTPRTQSCTFRNQPILAPKTVEDCLDRIVMIEQEMNDGTFAQLLVTPVTTSQASMAAPIAVPNATNTNAAGSSSSFAAADHVHQCATPTATQKGCITSQPFAAAQSTAGQSVTNGTTPIVVFGTEEIDTDSAYDNVTGRFTVPTGKGGHYEMLGCIAYANAQTGVVALFLYKNAANTKSIGVTNPGAAQGLCLTVLLSLSAGDIVDWRTSHPNGAPQSLTAAAGAVFLAIKKLPD